MFKKNKEITGLSKFCFYWTFVLDLKADRNFA